MSAKHAQLTAVISFEQQRCSASGGGIRAERSAVSAAAPCHAATQLVVERADLEAQRYYGGAGVGQTSKTRAKSSF